MVWRKKHRAGRKKRERIAASQKGPIITSVETGQFLTETTRQHLRRRAWRARHANRPVDSNIEIIDLTQNVEEFPTPETDQNESQLDDTQNPEIIDPPTNHLHYNYNETFCQNRTY